MARNKSNTTPSFEIALQELEQLVQQIETGQLSLDAALEAFERGVQLTRICQAKLQQVEQRVSVLNSTGQESSLPLAKGEQV